LVASSMIHLQHKTPARCQMSSASS
jgi:hypothetical protein